MRSIWRSCFQKLKNLQLFENLHDADIILMHMFIACRVKMKQISLCMKNGDLAFFYVATCNANINACVCNV